MAKYLIDANLPYYFGLWNNSNYIHLNDLDDSWNDEIIIADIFHTGQHPSKIPKRIKS